MLTAALLVAVLARPSVAEDPGPWRGEWVTDFGAMRLEQTGDQVTGSLGKNGSLTATADGAKLAGDYTLAGAAGKAEWTLAEDGQSFTGKWLRGFQSGSWRGWRKDPQAAEKPEADFSGVWLSSLGVMQLKQEGGRVTGSYGAEGWGAVEGAVEGPRLKLTWKRLRWSGPATIEQTPDGERFFGVTEEANPTVWLGLRLQGFDLHAKAEAGETVAGRTEDGMLYYLRMPDGWQPGEEVDLVVLLHGSNWTTRGMVAVTAQRWPEVGERFAILGIQGQNWAKWSNPDDLRFNYAYTNWMGRSTYRGYPYTDRESPYLVMRAIDELDGVYSFGRVLVGGHSQGAFLTYLLHMHYPEKLAGTFPLAGGLVMQAEPNVFDDDDLQAAQRATPMVIVHGRNDRVVRYATGAYAYRRMLSHDFHRAQMLSPDRGHPYDFLPVGEAIAYLDAMSTTDADRLAEVAGQEASKKNWRAVGALLERAEELQLGESLAPIREAFESAAEENANKHLEAIRANQNGEWVDDFLIWHEQFAMSPTGAEAVRAYETLRQQHDEPAEKLTAEARAALRAGKRDEARAKYQRIVDEYYASRAYRAARAFLPSE